MDLSPVSVRALLNCHHPIGLMAIDNKYRVKRFSTLVRIGGGNRKVLSRLDHHRPARFERVFRMYTKTQLPYEWLLGRGLPLNPYLRGLIIDYLRDPFFPK